MLEYICCLECIYLLEKITAENITNKLIVISSHSFLKDRSEVPLAQDQAGMYIQRFSPGLC